MNRLLILSFAAVAGSGLAAIAAPRPPATLTGATAVALDVLCVHEDRRDLAVANGFDYWGGFSEFSGTDGALEVRPGLPCRLGYLGGRDGAAEVELALADWARRKGLRLSRLEGPDGATVAEGPAGRLEWALDTPPARRLIWTVEAVYSPASI